MSSGGEERQRIAHFYKRAVTQPGVTKIKKIILKPQKEWRDVSAVLFRQVYFILIFLLFFSFQAKFIFMVRDGRATVHSIISRKVTITGFDLTNYRQCMQKWNQAITTMYEQCKEIGDEKCLIVHYEQLVLQPKLSMKKILNFLNIPWHNNVLHHEDFINEENGVVLSK